MRAQRCWVVALWVLVGCTRDFLLPGGGPPEATIESVAPDPARRGDTVSIQVRSSRVLQRCDASVAGQAASCAAPEGSRCACTFLVPVNALEGPAAVSATVFAAEGSGTTSATVFLDGTPPAVDPAKVSVQRRPLGQDDVVQGLAGAVAEGGIAYGLRQVAAVRLWAAASGGEPLATVAPVGDGSFTAALPGTAALSPPRVWVSAVDLPGNESERAEIAAGRDDTAPTGRSAAIVIERSESGDQIRGLADAFSDTGALASIRVHAAADGASVLAERAPAADGGFAAVAVGLSYRTLWASAVDKCGNASAPVPAGPGADLDGPAVDGARIAYDAADDAVSGEAGAVSDAVTRVVRAQVYDAASEGNALGPELVPAADGSFPRAVLGAGGAPRVWLEAVDRVGNRTRALVRKVALAYDLRGQPGSRLAPALYAFEAATDPALASPGLAAALGQESTDGAAWTAGDGAEVRTLAAPATGVPLAWTALSPGPRSGAAAAYDPVRRRTVLFGGSERSNTALADTWELDSGRWVRVEGAVSPGRRQFAAMAFDADRRMVVLFGGNDPTGPGLLGDTWEFGADGWSEVSMPGPPRRSTHAMAWDERRRAVVLYGGQGLQDGLTDTWEYKDGAWSEVALPSTPPPLYAPQMAFDAGDETSSGGVVLYGGGEGPSLVPTGNLWQYRGPSVGWVQLSSSPPPPGRFYHSMTFDRARHRLVVTGGKLGTGASSPDVWELALPPWASSPTWTQRTLPRNLDGRLAAVMVYDAERRAPVMLGGEVDRVALSDAWELSAGGWRAVGPAPRNGHAVAWDAARGRLVLFGGEGGQPTYAAGTPTEAFSDTWEHDGASWSRVDAGPGPSARRDHAMVYDAARRKVVLFGGMLDKTFGTTGAHVLYGDTWELDGRTWTRVRAGGGSADPPARNKHAMTYDTARRRVLLYGGSAGAMSTISFSDTWQWDGAAWTQLAAVRPAESHALAYDAGRDRVVRAGGASGSFTEVQTYEFDGLNWLPVTLPPQSRLPERMNAAMAFDPGRGRMVLFGGRTFASELLPGAWEYAGAGWTQLTVPTLPERFGHAMVWDPAGARALLFGGATFSAAQKSLADLWSFAGSPAGPRTAAHAMVFPLDGATEVVSLEARWTGGGTSGDGSPGARLSIWSWSARRWVELGTHQSAQPALIASQVPASPGGYARDGPVWLLATPLVPSGSGESRLVTDHAELRSSYLLPPEPAAGDGASDDTGGTDGEVECRLDPECMVLGPDFRCVMESADRGFCRR